MTVAPALRDELARLDLLLHREILRARAAYQLSLDEYRGVYVSDERVDALVADVAARSGGDATAEALTESAAALERQIGDASPLGRAARRLGLGRFERDVLLLALAPELQLKYEPLYAYLNNHATRTLPTIELALRVCGHDVPDERAQLEPAARLFADGLLERAELRAEARSELSRPFALAPALAAWLQELPVFDRRLAEWVAPLGDADTDALLCDDTEAALAELAGQLGRTATPPIVLLQAAPEQAPASAARRLLARSGRGALRLDGRLLPDARPPLATLPLVARLRGDGVYVDTDDWTAEAPCRLLPAMLAALWRARVPVVVAATPDADWRALTRELPTLRLRLEEPAVAARHALWRRALDRASVALPARPLVEVAEHFRLGTAQIATAARLIAIAAPPAGDDAAAREALFAVAREVSSGALGGLATPVPPRHSFSDLVLPPVVLRRLRDVSGAIRSRARVFGDWGFGGRSGRGLIVLFSGSSGTGKTMSASVIAHSIGLELHRIDLATVVSKYIGETEKNLQRIFDAARMANVILFFDEADALLGRRSEVKDAHDRYANIEVAYLLQQMEEHDGVVILASNLSKNLDPAFGRRIHYVIEFPRPDAGLRDQLWRNVFPRGVPLAADVDFGFLARQFDLAGGDIKTIALDAAFLAASEQRMLTMTDLVGAVSRQMLKQGRPLGAGDFKQYHGRLADDGDGVAGALPVG